MSVLDTVGMEILREIVEKPHDRELRLFFADMLAEHGNADQQRWAELIQVQRLVCDGDTSQEVLERECGLRRMLEAVFNNTNTLGLMHWQALSTPLWWHAGKGATISLKMSYGFIEDVFGCSSERWREHGPSLVRSEPIRKLKGIFPLNWLEYVQVEDGGEVRLELHVDRLPFWIRDHFLAMKRGGKGNYWRDTLSGWLTQEQVEEFASTLMLDWARSQANLPSLLEVGR